MFVGQRIILKICCPDCGTPLQQANVSDFFVVRCQNRECDGYGTDALIERRTGEVISAHAYSWKTFDGKRYRFVVEEVKEEGKNG